MLEGQQDLVVSWCTILAKECCSCLYSDLTSSKQALHLVRGYLIASVDISFKHGKRNVWLKSGVLSQLLRIHFKI